MNFAKVTLALVLALGVTAGSARAQFSAPPPHVMPGHPGMGQTISPQDLPPELKQLILQKLKQLSPEELKQLPPELRKMLDEIKDGKGGDDDDDIVVIPGPQIGGGGHSQQQQQTPVINPQMLEMLYNQVYLKVSKEYQDPYKLQDWAKWESKYKGKLKTEADLDAAIKDMVGSLKDRWTVYTSPGDIAAQQQRAKDGFISVGMMLRTHSDKKWHIDGIQFNTPAMKSTLREGDVIKSINGKQLDENTSPAEVSKLLSGKEGEKVTVVALWDGAEHSVEMTLAKQGPNDVAIGMLPGNIAYVRLPTFVKQETVQEFVQALTQLYQESGGQINGLVFDLRYNSGGLVTMALAVSSMFVEDGTITATTTRQDRSITETHYKVMPIPQYLEARMPKPMGEFQHFLNTVPLVVLTNGSTASASEITTGALKDNHRAFVIGVKTFGKAVGFTDTPLPNGGAIRVTNLKYLTPNGNNIADKGIEPDQVVEQPRGQEILGESDEQVKAAHEHLLKIAAERARQLNDAQDLSTKPHGDPHASHANISVQPLFVVLSVMGVGGLLMVVAFVISRRRNRQ